jgi:TatD DNase family protein
MLFDAHTHIQFPAYDADREETLARAKRANVKMIAVGTQYATSAAGVALAEKYPEDVWASVGFHPNHALPAEALAKAGGWHHDPKEQKFAKPEIFDRKKFEELAGNPKVVAIGECGLDYYRIVNNEFGIKERQRNIFESQIEIARAVGKPLMIHARPSKGTDDAYEDVLDILGNPPPTPPPSKEGGGKEGLASSLSKRGKIEMGVSKIIHFYEGSFEMTRKLVEAGYYFTFGGIITWKRDYDDILAYIPLERILLETDAPYVAPLPYRGSRNEPAYVVETAKKLAELSGKSFEEICQITTENVKTVFGIK